MDLPAAQVEARKILLAANSLCSRVNNNPDDVRALLEQAQEALKKQDEKFASGTDHWTSLVLEVLIASKYGKIGDSHREDNLYMDTMARAQETFGSADDRIIILIYEIGRCKFYQHKFAASASYFERAHNAVSEDTLESIIYLTYWTYAVLLEAKYQADEEKLNEHLRLKQNTWDWMKRHKDKMAIPDMWKKSRILSSRSWELTSSGAQLINAAFRLD